ncbi:MAG: TauD/TfdA family dioxygenase [Gammaproteobacteria bacterium]|nr:TauD/TfdA family dioxygenase [Gammaproteobacteria bacterium]
MEYKHISLQPIAGSLGAIIKGVDLKQSLSDDVYAEIKAALLENLVVFFRDQDITPEQQIAFGRRFGELHVHPFIPSLEGHDEIIQLKAESGDNPYLRLSNAWHPDLSYTSAPPLGAILRGVTIPYRGGDTMWVNLYKAYETLSDQMKDMISDLVAYHDLTKTYRPEDMRTKVGAERFVSTYEKSPPIEQPLVQVHPETGRKMLYLSELTTTSIKGLHQHESDAILKMLFNHLDWKELHCRFYWEPNSIAMWDNRCTCHYAVRDYEEPREMHRVTIIGDVLT